MSGGTIKAGDGCGYPCGYDCNLACFDRATPANATDTAKRLELAEASVQRLTNAYLSADQERAALRAENKRLTAEMAAVVEERDIFERQYDRLRLERIGVTPLPQTDRTGETG